MLKSLKILVGEAEVVPGVGIVGKLLSGGYERIAGGFGFLLIEKRDSKIEACHGEFRIGLQRLLKKLLRISGALLVEVSDAKSVQAQSL